jgi:mono/diheme cytochrome c family protein
MRPSETVVEVKLPASLSPMAREGERLYQVHCQVCHGVAGRGSPTGPPLVHSIYSSEHHTDTAFTLAVQLGVRGHHWGVRNMPAQPELDESTIQKIILFVRELQRANGIR